MSFFNFFGKRFLQACTVLVWLVAPSGFTSSARAADTAGTAIITLNVPITADGSAGDPYHAYYIRAQSKDGHADVHFLWHEGWAVSTADDLAAVGGHGAVIMKELPAGDWEVNTFRLDTHGRVRWYPIKTFSIPFKIVPGHATYIGSYQPVAYKYKNLIGVTTFGGASFVVTDQSARDIPIAKAKMSSPMPIDVDVFSVDTLNNPLLSSSSAAAPPDETAFSDSDPG